MKGYEKRAASSGRKKTAQKTELSYHPDDFRIYFPSHKTVSQSRGGKNVSPPYYNREEVYALIKQCRVAVLYAFRVNGGSLRHFPES